MMETTDRGRPVQAGASLARGVAAIVVTGMALGLGFNYLSRQAAPGRGLAWIAEERKLDSLEDHQSPAGDFRASVAGIGTAADGNPDVSATEGVLAAKLAPGPTRRSSPPVAASPPSPPPAPAVPAAATVVPADMTDPMGIAAVPEGNDLPVIPDLGRPLQMQLPAVKRFFDAKAALMVDAREPGEFAEGHIPGAINMPYDQVITDPARIEALDPQGKAIIIYCGGGTCEVSMNLAFRMVEQGKKKVLVFMGGWPEWQAAGYPVSKGDS